MAFSEGRITLPGTELLSDPMVDLLKLTFLCQIALSLYILLIKGKFPNVGRLDNLKQKKKI